MWGLILVGVMLALCAALVVSGIVMLKMAIWSMKVRKKENELKFRRGIDRWI